jgi:SHS2 domain-containing protein
LQERLFKQLKDKILEAKGRSLLSLSDDEQSQYSELKQLLEEKKERRLEMKNQMESYRKALGGSSLDFEKAMTYRELMEAEKESLEHINTIIEEIEQKITQIEG